MFAGVTGQVLLALLGLVTIGILTRSLGPADFGNYRTVLTYLSLAGVFANLGTHTLALREISRDGADREKLIGNALALRLTLTSSLLLLGLVVAPLFSFEPIVVQGIVVGLFGWVAYQVNEVTVSVFFYKMQQHLASAAEVIGTAVSCTLVILFAALDQGLLAMLAALVAGQLTTAVMAWVLASRAIPLRPAIDRDTWLFYLKTGWPIGASIVVNVMIMRGDTILIALMHSAEDVGYYGVGIKISEILMSIAMLFANLMMPLLVQSVRNKESFRHFTHASLQVMLIVSLLIACVLLFFGEEIIRFIAGAQYGPSVGATQILSLAIIAYFITSVFRLALTSLGHQRAMLRADIWGLLVAVPAYAVLIYLWSFEGAAWARVLANIAIMLAAGVALIREIDHFFDVSAVWKLALAGVTTLLVFYGLDRIGCYWMINIALGSALYMGSLVLLKAIPLEIFLAKKQEQIPDSEQEPQ